MIYLDVISGFLGAGKTSFILKLLNTCYKDDSVAVLVNEAGRIRLNDHFEEQKKDASAASRSVLIKEIPTGCICCNRSDLLSETLTSLTAGGDFCRILLEPSGTARLADLLPFLQTQFSEKVCLSHVVTVVDASSFDRRMLLSKEFFERQLKNSPLIFLTRTEELPPEKLTEIQNQIAEITTGSRILQADLKDWDALSQHAPLSYTSHTLPLFSKYRQPKGNAGKPVRGFSVSYFDEDDSDAPA